MEMTSKSGSVHDKQAPLRRGLLSDQKHRLPALFPEPEVGRSNRPRRATYFRMDDSKLIGKFVESWPSVEDT